MSDGRFKEGQHWRPRQLWWDKAWLENEYVTLKQSASEIAERCGCTENNIGFWLVKHGIPRRTMREVRQVKRWGATGEKNPMFGKIGILSPQWKGGLTPFRQRLYSSLEWKAFAAKVRRRDKTCRLCGSTERLEIHHIEPFSLAPLLVMAIGNVIRLCHKCHVKMRGRERWWRKRLYRLVQKGG